METASQDLLFPGNSSKNLLDECKGLAVEGFKEFRCETKEFATPTADPSPTLASSSVREAEINSQWDTEKESALNIRHKTIFNKRLCERECICTSVLRGYLVWLYVCVREREREREGERKTNGQHQKWERVWSSLKAAAFPSRHTWECWVQIASSSSSSSSQKRTNRGIFVFFLFLCPCVIITFAATSPASAKARGR